MATGLQNLGASDGTKRGPGCPRRRFGHFFAVEKVTRVWAGEARESSFEAVCFGRNRRGSSPKGAGAFSVHFCAYKSEPGSGAGRPGKSEPRVWGRGGPMVAPRPPGDGRISPASARCAGPAGAKQKRDLQRKLPLISTPAGGQGGKATSAAPAAPPGGPAGSPRIRTPASLPPLSSASPCARSPPPPPGG